MMLNQNGVVFLVKSTGKNNLCRSEKLAGLSTNAAEMYERI